MYKKPEKKVADLPIQALPRKDIINESADATSRTTSSSPTPRDSTARTMHEHQSMDDGAKRGFFARFSCLA